MRRRWVRGLLAAGLLTAAALAAPAAALAAPAATLAATTCNFRPVTITGTDGNDVIVGTPGNDVIVTGAGNDTVTGNAGNDTVCMGTGDDRFDGGPGSDFFVSESVTDGADVFTGGGFPQFGGDIFSYAARTAQVTVVLDGLANDGQTGERDNIDIKSYVQGGSGADLLTGSAGHDFLNGMAGDDTLTGLGDNDELWGNVGSDRMFGGQGDDYLVGGPGNDVSIADPVLDGADFFEGGSGKDEAQYKTRTMPLFLSLDTVANDGAQGEGDKIWIDVEDLSGGSAGDVLRTSGETGHPNGIPANSLLSGGGGNDILISLENDFTVDAVDGNAGSDVCQTDVGSDVKQNCEL
jgi:Ca2+-binding RTX toxin-like protein